MSDLPYGWASATIGDLSKKPQYGWTTKAMHEGSGIQFLRTTDITSGTVNWASVPFCTETPPDPEKYLLDDGDIVVSRAGSVGVSILVSSPQPSVFASYLVRLRPMNGVVPRYLALFMKSPDYWKQISEAASGIALQNVNASKIAKIRVPVAPVEEQQRIVDAIEEHLTRIDATGVWLSSAAKRASALEKAIITEASATLSPPEHWQVVTVGEAGDVSLGLQRSPKRHSGPSMRPYLRVANVYEDRIDGSDVMSMDMSDAEWTRFKLHDGDVLLNEGQSPQFLGRPAIYRGEPPDVAFTNSLIRFRPHNDIDPEWALLVFRSHLHNRRFMRESQITTNIAHLAAGRFKTIEFPIPPREEQAERIGRTRRALDACKRLEGDIAVGRRREKLLTASVLARAFSGKLVAQDPDDEPASSLLDRIRRDRSTSSEQRLPRKKAMA